MKPKKVATQFLKIILFLGLGVFILWLAFKNVAFEDIASGLKNANYLWLAFSLTFGILAYVVRAARWNLLIEPMGYKPRLRNTYHAVMTGYLANIAIPRIGEVSKCVALGRKESIPVDKLLGTILIERTVDVLTTIFITVFFVFFANENVLHFLKESILDPIRSSAGITISMWIFLTLCVLFVAVLALYRDRLVKYPVFSKIIGFIKGIAHGFVVITKLNKKWLFLLYTLLVWSCYLLMTWFVVFCLDSTSHLGINDAVFLLVIGTFGMMVPVQGGFGSFHYITSIGLSFVYGVTIEDGLIYSIISHESQVLLMIFLGTVSSIIVFGKKRSFRSFHHKEVI